MWLEPGLSLTDYFCLYERCVMAMVVGKGDDVDVGVVL